MFRNIPIKHGAHRMLDRIRPTCWTRGSTVVSMPYNGHLLKIDISDLVGWHFFILSNFDPEVSEILLRFASREDHEVFWDIGANKGTCAYQIASALPKCKIIAIEPQIELQPLLTNNLRLVAPGRHELFSVGIGEKPGQYEMIVPLGNTGRATLTNYGANEPHDTQTITVVTAESLKEQSQHGWPTLVKIDVEGFEASVISSLVPAFQSKHVKCCVFECHRNQAASYNKIRVMAQESGYNLYAITKTPFTTKLIAASQLIRHSTDYAIVRKDCIHSRTGASPDA